MVYPGRVVFTTCIALCQRLADKVDVLAAKEKAFFASCKRLKASERNDEYEKVNRVIFIHMRTVCRFLDLF